jgi:hypothetical protein
VGQEFLDHGHVARIVKRAMDIWDDNVLHAPIVT